MPRPRKELTPEEAIARIDRHRERCRVRNNQLYRENEEFRRRHAERMKQHYEANKAKYKESYERRKALKAVPVVGESTLGNGQVAEPTGGE